MQRYYNQGFIDKCAEFGVSANNLVKLAQWRRQNEEELKRPISKEDVRKQREGAFKRRGPRVLPGGIQVWPDNRTSLSPSELAAGDLDTSISLKGLLDPHEAKLRIRDSASNLTDRALSSKNRALSSKNRALAQPATKLDIQKHRRSKGGREIMTPTGLVRVTPDNKVIQLPDDSGKLDDSIGLLGLLNPATARTNIKDIVSDATDKRLAGQTAALAQPVSDSDIKKLKQSRGGTTVATQFGLKRINPDGSITSLHRDGTEFGTKPYDNLFSDSRFATDALSGPAGTPGMKAWREVKDIEENAPNLVGPRKANLQSGLRHMAVTPDNVKSKGDKSKGDKSSELSKRLRDIYAKNPAAVEVGGGAGLGAIRNKDAILAAIKKTAEAKR